jgi:hypothetical protein
VVETRCPPCSRLSYIYRARRGQPANISLSHPFSHLRRLVAGIVARFPRRAVQLNRQNSWHALRGTRVLKIVCSRPLSAPRRRNSPKDEYSQNLDYGGRSGLRVTEENGSPSPFRGGSVPPRMSQSLHRTLHSIPQNFATGLISTVYRSMICPCGFLRLMQLVSRLVHLRITSEVPRAFLLTGWRALHPQR